MIKRFAPVLLATPLLFFWGCGKPQQQKPPRIADDGQSGLGPETEGSDIAAEEDGPVPVENAKEETPAERRTKCCQECVAGVADDKSGDPPGALACKTLTGGVGAGCVLWFDKNPMNGKEAQACIEEGG